MGLGDRHDLHLFFLGFIQIHLNVAPGVYNHGRPVCLTPDKVTGLRQILVVDPLE